MITISGIEHQKELEELPFFSKNEASVLIGKVGGNLDKKLTQLTRIGYLKNLKKGVYVSSAHVERVEKELYSEYISNILRLPSYISTEYVLAKQGLIPESVFAITSITRKTSRNYSNFLGKFIYRKIKDELFIGFNKKIWKGNVVFIASKAKALFDYFYLKKVRNVKTDVFDTRINWDEFSDSDMSEFTEYVKISKSTKMKKVLKYVKEFNDTF